jgi:hypothetical protein
MALHIKVWGRTRPSLRKMWPEPLLMGVTAPAARTHLTRGDPVPSGSKPIPKYGRKRTGGLRPVLHLRMRPFDAGRSLPPVSGFGKVRKGAYTVARDV